MAWIKVDQSLMTHRKTMTLAEELDLSEQYAASHVITLWLWAIDNALDGKLPNSDKQIAKAAGWDGPAQPFVEALVFAGFVDDDYMGNREIHDWAQYSGALRHRREVNKDRQKRWRTKHEP